MNAIGLLRVQLDASFELVRQVADETPAEAWTWRPSAAHNPAGFTLWHCVRCIDWAVNCAIQGLPEVADEPRWRGRLAPHAWFGYDVSAETADEVAAMVPRPDLVEYAGDVQARVMPWLDSLSEDDLDAVPDIRGNYTSTSRYADSPRLQAWIEEDSGVPAWRFLTGTCTGHVRAHIGEVEALLQVLSSGTSV